MIDDISPDKVHLALALYLLVIGLILWWAKT